MFYSIAEAFPFVSSSWLLTGEGEMLRPTSGTSPERGVAVAKAVKAEGGEGIPLIPVDAMAGVFAGEVTVSEYECERYSVPSLKGADFLISVSGQSMYPVYHSGDLVACRLVPLRDLFFQWGRTYVIDTDQGALIKRIEPGCDDDHITVVSENKAFSPFQLHRSCIHHVAIVCGLIRTE